MFLRTRQSWAARYAESPRWRLQEAVGSINDDRQRTTRRPGSNNKTVDRQQHTGVASQPPTRNNSGVASSLPKNRKKTATRLITQNRTPRGSVLVGLNYNVHRNINIGILSTVYGNILNRTLNQICSNSSNSSSANLKHVKSSYSRQ